MLGCLAPTQDLSPAALRKVLETHATKAGVDPSIAAGAILYLATCEVPLGQHLSGSPAHDPRSTQRFDSSERGHLATLAISPFTPQQLALRHSARLKRNAQGPSLVDALRQAFQPATAFFSKDASSALWQLTHVLIRGETYVVAKLEALDRSSMQQAWDELLDENLNKPGSFPRVTPRNVLAARIGADFEVLAAEIRIEHNKEKAGAINTLSKILASIDNPGSIEREIKAYLGGSVLEPGYADSHINTLRESAKQCLSVFDPERMAEGWANEEKQRDAVIVTLSLVDAQIRELDRLGVGPGDPRVEELWFLRTAKPGDNAWERFFTLSAVQWAGKVSDNLRDLDRLESAEDKAQIANALLSNVAILSKLPELAAALQVQYRPPTAVDVFSQHLRDGTYRSDGIEFRLIAYIANDLKVANVQERPELLALLEQDASIDARRSYVASLLQQQEAVPGDQRHAMELRRIHQMLQDGKSPRMDPDQNSLAQLMAELRLSPEGLRNAYANLSFEQQLASVAWPPYGPGNEPLSPSTPLQFYVQALWIAAHLEYFKSQSIHEQKSGVLGLGRQAFALVGGGTIEAPEQVLVALKFANDISSAWWKVNFEGKLSPAEIRLFRSRLARHMGYLGMTHANAMLVETQYPILCDKRLVLTCIHHVATEKKINADVLTIIAALRQEVHKGQISGELEVEAFLDDCFRASGLAYRIQTERAARLFALATVLTGRLLPRSADSRDDTANIKAYIHGYRAANKPVRSVLKQLQAAPGLAQQAKVVLSSL
jgi:hypothetical protein